MSAPRQLVLLDIAISKLQSIVVFISHVKLDHCPRVLKQEDKCFIFKDYLVQ